MLPGPVTLTASPPATPWLKLMAPVVDCSVGFGVVAVVKVTLGEFSVIVLPDVLPHILMLPPAAESVKLIAPGEERGPIPGLPVPGLAVTDNVTEEPPNGALSGPAAAPRPTTQQLTD